jgi:uncharacterized protein (DUF2147 family)
VSGCTTTSESRSKSRPAATACARSWSGSAGPTTPKGLPLVDLKHPDPALRKRPLLGLTVLRGLRRTGENTWEDGRIYNPDDGTEYNASMSIQNDSTLRVRAYVLLPLFGHTFIWTRVR